MNTTELTIREIIARHGGTDGYWANLCDVRADMDIELDLDPAQQVTILKALSKARRVNIAPNSDCKNRTAADHAAAFKIGGQAQHLICLGALPE